MAAGRPTRGATGTGCGRLRIDAVGGGLNGTPAIDSSRASGSAGGGAAGAGRGLGDSGMPSPPRGSTERGASSVGADSTVTFGGSGRLMFWPAALPGGDSGSDIGTGVGLGTLPDGGPSGSGVSAPASPSLSRTITVGSGACVWTEPASSRPLSRALTVRWYVWPASSLSMKK